MKVTAKPSASASGIQRKIRIHQTAEMYKKGFTTSLELKVSSEGQEVIQNVQKWHSK